MGIQLVWGASLLTDPKSGSRPGPAPAPKVS